MELIKLLIACYFMVGISFGLFIVGMCMVRGVRELGIIGFTVTLVFCVCAWPYALPEILDLRLNK